MFVRRRFSQDKGGADALTFTLMKNDAATTITCVLQLSSTVKSSCSDTTHSVAVAVGDLVAYQVSNANALDANNPPNINFGYSIKCQ